MRKVILFFLKVSDSNLTWCLWIGEYESCYLKIQLCTISSFIDYLQITVKKNGK